MDIRKYIQDYDFSDTFKKNKDEFIQQTSIQKYLTNYPEDNFIKFSQEFWLNPNLSIDILKSKYNINKQISFSKIIKAYPNDTYIKFLSMYYSNTSYENLSKEFAIPFNRIIRLILPITVDDIESNCPKCFNNSFIIEYSKDNEITLICMHCHRSSALTDLLTKEQMEAEKKENVAFCEKMVACEKNLREIKCPKCQDKLYLIKIPDKKSYIIKCEKCKYSSDNITNTIEEYNTWKKRAGMMIAIKAKEQELIEKALDCKKYQDINFIKEDIIESNENNETVQFWEKTLVMDYDKSWIEFFKKIKTCNRLEKKVLIKFMELILNENKIKTINLNKEIPFYTYETKEPIISYLIEKTGILIIRKILRKLMEQNLILVNEITNFIAMPKLLIENIDIIKNLMIVKDMNPNIRYLVFQRENFTCTKCGETGRPLKIAFLTSNKNINDLSNLVTLCDYCYDVMTKNEILIDVTITSEVGNITKNKFKSLDYLTYYYPDLKNNNSIKETLEDWEQKFNFNDIVKALTITIDRIKRNKLTGEVTTLINYTTAILRNNTPVDIYENLKKEYGLDKWLEDELD